MGIRVALLVSIVAILAAVGFLAWMGTNVTPKFEEVFRGLPGGTNDLPVTTRMMLGVSNWCAHWWWVCALAAAAGLWLLRRAFATSRPGQDR